MHLPKRHGNAHVGSPQHAHERTCLWTHHGVSHHHGLSLYSLPCQMLKNSLAQQSVCGGPSGPPNVAAVVVWWVQRSAECYESCVPTVCCGCAMALPKSRRDGLRSLSSRLAMCKSGLQYASSKMTKEIVATPSRLLLPLCCCRWLLLLAAAAAIDGCHGPLALTTAALLGSCSSAKYKIKFADFDWTVTPTVELD